MKIKLILLLISSVFHFSPAYSADVSTNTDISTCELNYLASTDDSLTLGQIRKICSQTEQVEIIHHFGNGAFSSRSIKEREREDAEFVLTPHRMNFLLPVYTTSATNDQAYQGEDLFFDGFKEVESHFQISLKFPLSFDSVFVFGDKFYGAFTLEAWWQVYAKGISSPFRETNYTPELFYVMPLSSHGKYGNTGLVLGVEHQSNGRSGDLSRSWNRVYAEFLYENNNFVAFVRPWYRLPEDLKAFPNDPDGDDNPDIQDYLGYGQLGLGYSFRDFKVSMLAKGNFATHKGGVRLDITTPLYGRLRGYVKLYHGYGDSLIDYDHSQTRFGIGLTLNSLF